MTKSKNTRGQPAIAPYIQPPAQLRGFPRAEKATPKTPFSGRKLRRRWKDSESGLIYEWDYRHGLVEVYDRYGRHLYEADPATGAKVGERDANRRVEP